MSVKHKIGAILYKSVANDRFSFNTAVKIYGVADTFLGRKKSPSGRFTRKNILGHIEDATNPNNKMAWTSVGFPCEVLYLFDIYPMMLEAIASTFATIGLSPVFIDKADSEEIPNTMCSFHRVIIGASETKFLGTPSLVAATSIMCDGNSKSFYVAANNKNVPFLFIDIPYEYSEEGVWYVKDQLQNAIKMFEDISGIKYNKDKFELIVKKVNEAFGLSRKFYKLKQNSSVNTYQGYEIAGFAFPRYFMLGSNRLVNVLRERCRDVEKGLGYNRFYKKRNSRKSARRIMWLHITPQYDNDMWSIIDNGKTSKIVCDEYSSTNLEDYDISDPLGSIAKRLITHPSNGPLERRIDHILKVAKDYKVDGIIHYSSWGCHQAAGNVQILGKALIAAGYKFLNINGDSIDQRNSSTEQHRTRLEAFLEN